MSLKTGIVGCGKVGDFHAKAYSQLGSSAFAAVCDADLDRARAFAERYLGASGREEVRIINKHQ